MPRQGTKRPKKAIPVNQPNIKLFKSPPWRSLRQRVASRALRLVEPASSIQEPEARLNARLLAALLLTLLFMVLVGAFVISTTAYPAGIWLLWGAVIPLLGAYALSRTRHYQLAAALSILIFSLMPYVAIALVAPELSSDLLFLSLAWLSLPLLLTSLFFAVRITAVYAALIILSVLLIPALIPNVDRTAANTALGLILTVFVLVVVLMYHRERIERSRQATLAESEARYRRLAENAQDIIYRYSRAPQSRITYINPAVKDILGYAPDEFYADPDLFFNLIYPNDRPALLSITSQNVPLDKPITLRWVRKDGTLAWIEHRNVDVADRAGNLIAVEGIGRDITERKQLEETLRRSEASLAEAQRIAHFGSWTWDLATGKLQCSDEMFRIVGLRPQEVEVTQEVFLKFLHPDEVEWILQEIQHSMADTPLAGIEHRIIRSNGEIRKVHSRVKIYRDEHGSPLRLLGSTQDITERQRMVEVVQEQRTLAETLRDVAIVLNSTLKLDEVLDRVLANVDRIVPYDSANIMLIDASRDIVRIVRSRGYVERGLGDFAQSLRFEMAQLSVLPEASVTRQPIVVPDTQLQPGWQQLPEVNWIRSYLCAPICVREQAVGFINLDSATPGFFTLAHAERLQTLAEQVALAIENARLFEAERRRVQEQAALLEITQMALSSYEFSQPVMKHIARRVAQACHASQCLLFLLEEQASTIRPLLAQHADGHEDPDIRQAVELLAAERLDALPLLGVVVRERRPRLFKDAQQAGLLPADWKRLFGVERILAVPLLSQAEVIGLMILDYDADRIVDDRYFDLALTIGAQIAIAFANMYLYADLQRALQHERDARAQVVQAEKLAAIGRLAASVAHELNNPLQAIQNSLYLVRQENTLDKQAQDDLDVALTESRRMADLIDRMRETYRPTTATEFHPESLNVLIAEVEKLISTHLRHNEITFEFKPDPRLPLVPCLYDHLKQVILNVSLNAVDAMPNGGRLTVSTSMSPETNGIWMTFADTGQGIAREDLPNIFDPFFTRKAGGTGLGLAISYDIVQHHRGRIEVESEQGQGTTFRIWLPTKGP